MNIFTLTSAGWSTYQRDEIGGGFDLHDSLNLIEDLASSEAREAELREALNNLRRWCREFMSYPAAMRQIGQILKERLDGALFTADAAIATTTASPSRERTPPKEESDE
jgi:hypothetical protein